MSNKVNINTAEDQVYHIIRHKINMQIIKPGERINENKLAEELGVSRSPIREALKRLAGDELVETIPNRGSFARKICVRDIEEMYQARIMFEVFTVQNMELLPTPEQKSELADIFERMQTAYDREDIYAYLVCDRELHQAIVNLSGNRFIQGLYDRLNWHINVIQAQSNWDMETLSTIHEEHLLIREHLAQNNFPILAAILPPHLRRGAKYVLQSM